MSLARRRFVVLAACAMGACARLPSPVEEQPTKAVLQVDEAKRAILAERSQLWKDPDSIRDAKIGRPYSCPIDDVTPDGRNIMKLAGSCVCVQLNAKNSFGGYVGLKGSIVAIPEDAGRHPQILDTGTAGADPFCQSLVPFDALNGVPPPKGR